MGLLRASARLGPGYRVDVHTGGHDYVVDAPSPVSTGAGARPGELLVAALVSCKAQVVRQFCHQHRVDLRSCGVEAVYGPTSDPHTGERRNAFRVDIMLDAALSADQITQLLGEVESECTVDQLLRAGTPVHTTIRVR